MTAEIDNTTKLYIHVIKIDNNRYRVYSYDLISKGTFDSKEKALAKAKRMQLKKKYIILVHDINGDVVDVYYPLIKSIPLSDNGKPKKNAERRTTPKALRIKHA